MNKTKSLGSTILVAALLGVTIPSMGQQLPFPGWVSLYYSIPYSIRKTINHPIMFPEPMGWSTALTQWTNWTRGERFEFAGTSLDGVIAVREWVTSPISGSTSSYSAIQDWGGLPTNFVGILSIDAGPAFPLLGISDSIVVAGIRSDGSTGFGVFVWGSTYPLGTISMIDLGLTSPRSKRWIRGNLIGGMLYIFESGTSACRFIRYLDSNQDLIPDQLDTTFEVLIPHGSMGFFNLLRPRSDALFAIGRNFANSDRWLPAVVMESGSYVIRGVPSPMFPPPPSPLPPSLGPLVGGARQLVIAGEPGSNIVLETAPSAIGPWTPVPAFVHSMPGDAVWSTHTLSVAPTPGIWARLIDVSLGLIGEATLVQEAVPILFKPVATPILVRGSTSTISGFNMNMVSSLVFRRDTMGLPSPELVYRSLTIINQTSEALTFEVPQDLPLGIAQQIQMRFPPFGPEQAITLQVKVQ
jgi:hypothetical protein